MKHQILIIIITIMSYTPINTMYYDIIRVKLNDGTQQTIDNNIAYKSNTIHKKQRWKERLSINPNLPILLHNISPDALKLFKKACSHNKETFMFAFFDKLSKEDQKDLTSVAGKTHLNSPEITLLLTQQLPTDICNTIAHNFEKDKKKITHYLQCAMIKKNITAHPIIKYNDSHIRPKTATIYHPKGTLSHVPLFFSSANNLCTNNAGYKILAITNEHTAAILNNKKMALDAYKKFIHYAGKQINNCTYLITSGLISENDIPYNTDCYLWRIKTDSEKQNKPEIIGKQFNNFQQKKITWSPNGMYIAISSNPQTNQLILLTLNPSTPTITTNEQLLEVDGHQCSEIAFNNTSTALAATLYSPIADTSQLIIYDVFGTVQSKTPFIGECHSLCFNRNNTRLIGAVTRENRYYKAFVWNTTDLAHIAELAPERCFIKNLDVAPLVHYSPYADNTAVAHISNGDLLLIEELNGSIKSTYLIHEEDKIYVQPDYPLCSLFSPDGKFLFHHTNSLYPETQYIANLPLISSYIRHAKLMVWDIHTKQLIAEYKSNDSISAKQPQIALATDGCRLITNHEKQSWLLHQLYTKEEQATLTWIKNNANVFELYALRQLYRAHKQQHTINPDDNTLLSTIIDSLPDRPYTIKQCVLDYLIYKQNNGLLSKAVEFMQSFWK